jgi:hypothetical protein
VGFDVLLILDCCHAAGSVTKGGKATMEVLAGCSREGIAGGPGSSRAIGSPFTYVLTKHLREEAARPGGLVISELLTLMSLDEVLANQSPIHVVLSGHHDPIKLGPSSSQAAQKNPTILRALNAISFRGNLLPEVREFVWWLNSKDPSKVGLR